LPTLRSQVRVASPKLTTCCELSRSALEGLQRRGLGDANIANWETIDAGEARAFASR
jgi:hypothetical protein